MAIAKQHVNMFSGESKLIFYNLNNKNENYVGKFEEEFSKYIGVKHSIAVPSGRIGLFLILRALNFRNGSDIILPAYTFYVVPSMIVLAGLRPNFVDINENSLNIDCDLIEEAITPKTKAIIATHLFGLPANLDKIKKIANKHGLIIIEDCCQSLGAKYKNKRVGSLGLLNYFSFSSSKSLNTIEGGMITTDNDKLAVKITAILKEYRELNQSDLIERIFSMYLLKIFSSRFIFTTIVFPFLYLYSFFSNEDLIYNVFSEKKELFKELPRNYKLRFSNLQGLLGLLQLSNIENINEKKIKNAMFLKDKLNVKTQDFKGNIFYQFIIIVNDKDMLFKKLIRRGIDTQKEYCQVCSDLEIFKDFKKDCKVARKVARQILHIPIYHTLTSKDLYRIASLIK